MKGKMLFMKLINWYHNVAQFDWAVTKSSQNHTGVQSRQHCHGGQVSFASFTFLFITLLFKNQKINYTSTTSFLFLLFWNFISVLKYTVEVRILAFSRRYFYILIIFFLD